MANAHSLEAKGEMDFISRQRREHLLALQKGTAIGAAAILLILGIAYRTAPQVMIKLLSPLLLLIGGSLASHYLLRERGNYLLASRLYILTALVTMALMMLVARLQEPALRNIAPFSLVLIAPVTALFLSSEETYIYVAAGLLWVFLFAFKWGGNMYDFAAALLTMASTAVAIFSAGNLYQMADWAMQSYRRSEERADELWQSQESLRKALAKQDWLNEQLRISNLSLEQAREAAEEANRLKTQFVANMSHELRTPLNSIINFTRIVMGGYAGPITEEQITYLDYVRYAGEHLLGLINDILDLAKIEAGKLEVHVAPLDLHPLLDGVMSTTVGLTRDKALELRKLVPHDLPLVLADEKRVRQVLLNLLSNAAKFTDAGSITLRAEVDGDFVRLSVADTGIGIAPEHFDRVFEEFRQVDERVARRIGGTGLGMPISKKLVEMQGGEMWFESELGSGSTFYFTLPIYHDADGGVHNEGGITS